MISHFLQLLQDRCFFLRVFETKYSICKILLAKLNQTNMIFIRPNFHVTDEVVEEVSNSPEIGFCYAARAVDGEVYVVISFLGALH